MTRPTPVPSFPHAPPSLRAVLVPFVCFFLSGASGLVFEVIWTRMLTLVFGATTPAISTVLSAFMGGLALGSFVLGRIADRLKFPLVTYAMIECGVGVLALVLPFVVGGVYPPVSHWITNHGGNRFDVFTLLRFVVVAAVLLPPTTLMGATLPLLARHFVRSGGALGQRVGALYAVNTFGAVAGTFLAGFVLLPHLGLRATNAIAAGTNVLLAVLIVLFRHSLMGGAWPRSLADLRPVPRGTVLDDTLPETADSLDPDDTIDEVFTANTRRAVLLAAAGSGFAALAYEVILSRALDMVLGSSVYSFTIILMAFLVGIGGGSGVASAILRLRPAIGPTLGIGGLIVLVALGAMSIYPTRAALMVFVLVSLFVLLALVVASTYRRPALALGAVQLLVGIGAACTYYFQDKVPRMFVHLAMTAADLCRTNAPLTFSHHIGTIQFTSFLTAMLCALPAALGMGATFPLAIRAFAHGSGSVGRDTGTVYSVNTLGSIAGSFLTGFVIMPAVGMETTFYLAVGVNLALALLLMLATPGEEPLRYVLVPVTAVLLAIATTGTVLGRDGRLARSEGRFALFPHGWNQERMTLGVFRLSLADGMIVRRNDRCIEAEDSDRERGLGDENPIFYRDGVTTTVTVERWSMGDHAHFALKNNGKVDASNGDDMPTQVLVAALPLLLHPRGPSDLDVAMVGWGSGVSVGTVLQFPVKHLDVIELERATIDGSRFFTDVNHLQYTLPEFPFVTVPRLNVLNNDGRNYLASTDHRYDVVISEPSNPWITGVSNLFTAEHFRAASRSLAPGGIFVQWIQLYEMSPENIKTIFRTVTESFPYVRVFSADADSSDTVLLGSFSPIALDPARIDGFLASNATARAAVEAGHIDRATDILARLLFASRDEVRKFSTLEERRINGIWTPQQRSTGSEPCEPASCRRTLAPLNTDDNARIEFAAPRDLIGFDAFAGYTEVLYDAGWPYGRGDHELSASVTGDARVTVLANLGESLLAGGRPHRAGEVLDDALMAAGTHPVSPALEHAVGVFTAVTASGGPSLHLSNATPPPDLTPAGAQRVVDAFRTAAQKYEARDYRGGLDALEALPASAREASGPSVRMLYGVLLYESSRVAGARSRFADAIDELEHLGREELDWSLTHPELLFYVARARFQTGDYGPAVRAMGQFVEMIRRRAESERGAGVPAVVPLPTHTGEADGGVAGSPVNPGTRSPDPVP